MKAELLEKAVTEDRNELLKPIVDAAYKLEPMPSFEAVILAHDINKKLGYDLFTDLYYPRLIVDFSRVARAVQMNAYKNK